MAGLIQSKIVRILSLVAIIMSQALFASASEHVDSLSSSTDSVIAIDTLVVEPAAKDQVHMLDTLEVTPTAPAPVEMKNWWAELKKGRFDPKDTTVYYPKFMQFCVDVYNWGDQAFNGVDTTYVASTGRRWRAEIRNDNWADSYAFLFDKTPIRMLSDIKCNVGGYLTYMAVSVGYALDFGNIIGNKPSNHKKMEFNFSCARFSIDAYYSRNDDGTIIRHFGHYDSGRWFSYPFSDLRLETYGVDAYYFINNRKYSQGAAYKFSKIQRRSAGSLIVGVSAAHYDIDMDFTSLPHDMLIYLPTDQRRYIFNYWDYCFLVGYGYNVVLNKHLLFNITGLPSIGLKRSLHSATVDEDRDRFSMNLKGKLSLVYNNQDFFAGMFGKFDGRWFMGEEYQFFNTIASLSVSVGVRF